MRGRSILLVLICLLTLLPIMTEACVRSPNQVRHYTIYYGAPDSDKIEQLSRFDMAVIEPDYYDPVQIRQLNQNGTILLGYQNTFVVDKLNPLLPGLLPDDYLTINGTRVETVWGNRVMSFLDPRSAHVRELIMDSIKTRIYDKGLNGVFLDTLNLPAEYLDVYVSLDANELEDLKRELFLSTASMVNQIRRMNNSKYIAQKDGYRELKDYTCPAVDFLFWSDYPAELGDSSAWLNQKRAEVTAYKDDCSLVLMAYKTFDTKDYAAMNRFCCLASIHGFIPYAAPEGLTEINTDGLPAPILPSASESKPSCDLSYLIFYDYPSRQQLEEMKKFDLAIVEPRLITDDQLNELQAAGVIVAGYIPLTSIDQEYPPFAGLLDQDYLYINGQKAVNGNDIYPDWVMDPRSTHFRHIVVDAVKNVYERGFDGVFMDTVSEAVNFAVHHDTTVQAAVLNATEQLVKEIRGVNQGKLLIQNGGWWEESPYTVINRTAPYIDFMLWENYNLHENSFWLNKLENVQKLGSQYNFGLLACNFFSHNDYTGVKRFYDHAWANGFVPYASWTSDWLLAYTSVNTYNIPPRSFTPIAPPAPPAVPDVPAPPVPTITGRKALSASSIRLTWSASEGAVGYSVYRRALSENRYRLVGSAADTSFTDTGLKASTWYVYCLSAVDESGNCSAGSRVLIKTL